MAIITLISGAPLFQSAREAMVYGKANNLTGYHIHVYQGQTGYMAGANHFAATGTTANNTNVIAARVSGNNNATRTSATRTNATSPTMSSGGGSGY